MQLIEAVTTAPVPARTTYTVELTENDLIHMWELSHREEWGNLFPHGIQDGSEGNALRLHQKVEAIASHFKSRERVSRARRDNDIRRLANRKPVVQSPLDRYADAIFANSIRRPLNLSDIL